MTPPISWNKDALMIMVPRWTSMLADLSERVMKQTGTDGDTSQQSKSECPMYSEYKDYSVLVHPLMTSVPDMASSHMKTDEDDTKLTTLTLTNGVEMPVMGLGKCNINYL